MAMSKIRKAFGLALMGIGLSPILITFVPEWAWLPTALMMGPVWVFATKDRTIDRGIKQAERFANASTDRK